MLSRVADAVYWLGRYLERAENIARFLEVNWHLTLDMPGLQKNQWEALIYVTGDHAVFTERHPVYDKANVVRFLTFDKTYACSLLSSLSMARENARTVREMIPVEMWEMINTFYHLVSDAARYPDPVYANPFSLCEEVKRRSLMLAGIADSAMDHDEAWLFFELGRYMERADKTSRILDVKYFILLPDQNAVGTNLDFIQWAALLKAISGLQAYRHRYGRIQPIHVAEFLLLNHLFPRSVLFCLIQTQTHLRELTGTPIGSFSNEAEKLLGKLYSDLTYLSIDDVFQQGLHEFTDLLQLRLNHIDVAIFNTFFSLVPAVEGESQPQ